MVELLEPRSMLAADFGDAPDTGPGEGIRNYETLASNNGPSHTIDASANTLFLGLRVDGEIDGIPNSRAEGDDFFILPGADDEDGLVDSTLPLQWTIGSEPKVALRATNLTGTSATLFGWIDVSRNGIFENATERASIAVPNGVIGGVFELTFPTLPLNTPHGDTYARFRLSTDAAAGDPTGNASDGEVEDVAAALVKATSSSADTTRNRLIADNMSGGPLLQNSDNYGWSIANIGDFDRDGVQDLAVGAVGDDTGASDTGAVYIQLMNGDGTVKSRSKLASGINGLPTLGANERFGSSIAALGDLNGDGIVDLAVGARTSNVSGASQGAVYVLIMNANGTVQSSTIIGSGRNGGPALGSTDFFGFSVAALGDFDRDGTVDLAVGAASDDTGGTDRGAVHLLMLNSNGSVKSGVKIANLTSGGPSLANNDQFGSSIASLGDLDGDGIPDLAVGARFDDTEWTDAGAVHVLFLNANGSVKSTTKLGSNLNGAPDLSLFEEFGTSIASAGDVDADGIVDLAVGTPGDFSTGVVYVLRMTTTGVAKNFSRIAYNENGGPSSLSFSDDFGIAVASMGDMDGDGIVELAIGAIGEDAGGTDRGGVHILYLRSDTLGPRASFLRQAPTDTLTNSDALVYRVAFDEDVFNVDASDFVVDGTTATVVLINPISQSSYEVTIAGGNLPSLNGFVDLDLAATTNIQDRFGNALSTSLTNDDFYLIDNIAPSTLSIVRSIPNANPTSADGLRFVVSFSEGVTNVDASDFEVLGTSASLVVSSVSSNVYDLTLSGGNLANVVGSVGVQIASSATIQDFAGNVLPIAQPPILQSFEIVSSVLDFGDAPDTGPGTGFGNYQTSLADDGPRHNVVANLRLGVSVDVEPNGQLSDDGPNVSPDRDDEDGVVDPVTELAWTTTNAPSLRVRATNTTGSAATLFGWIDINRDGLFDNASERVSLAVPNNSNNRAFILNFPLLPPAMPAGKLHMRLRLSTDGAASNATGFAADGEVEDYVINLTRPGTFTFDSLKTRKIAGDTAGFNIADSRGQIGGSVTSAGDLDGDGVTDLAIGAPRTDGFFTDDGAVYLALMNANGTIKSRGFIGSESFVFSTNPTYALSSIPTLSSNDLFGSSIVSLGDLNGDGVPDLAVGAPGDDLGGIDRGMVYILLMRANGTVERRVEIGNQRNGGPTLLNSSRFGSAVASLGDFDGDGVNDLAVGANEDSTGGTARGAVYLLMMNSNGTVKSSSKIANLTGNFGLLANGDRFGSAIASLGDLDNDGITDIAVSAPNDDTGGIDRGMVYILFMNSDGTVQRRTQIGGFSHGQVTSANSDFFGSSLAVLGDVWGNGNTTLAIGALDNDFLGTNRGAVYLWNLETTGAASGPPQLSLIGHNSSGGPSLANFDQFGSSVASLGDVDGDGLSDILVGAQGDDTGGTDRGAAYILYGRADTTAPIPNSFRRQSPLGETTSQASLIFAARFTEDVFNVSTDDFVVGGGSTATVTNVTKISPSQYHLTVSGGNLSSFVGTVGINVSLSQNIVDRSNNLMQFGEPSVDETYTVVADATVVNRQIFYHRAASAVFGNGTGNPINAIDPLKVPLLPGQTPSFANYTNYEKGLNGLVIDIQNLLGTPTANDFLFATWNGIDSANFVATTATSVITVLPNQGINGSSRIKIEFNDKAVLNTWLRVTLQANSTTGLLADDVFYFGNAIGDMGAGNTGDPTVVRVNATDTSIVRQNQSNTPDSAGISSIYDVDKNGRINSIDTSIVRQNSAGMVLRYFTPPASLTLSPTVDSRRASLAATPKLETTNPFSIHSSRTYGIVQPLLNPISADQIFAAMGM